MFTSTEILTKYGYPNEKEVHTFETEKLLKEHLKTLKKQNDRRACDKWKLHVEGSNGTSFVIKLDL